MKIKITVAYPVFVTLLLSAAMLVGCGGAGSSSTASAQHEWAWMGGSQSLNSRGSYGTKGMTAETNTPSARSNSAYWTDAAGNLWLFGGIGYDANGTLGGLNDLWRYSNRQWAWISGSKTSPGPAVPGGAVYSSIYGNIGAVGVYGTLGTAAVGNTPGARSGAQFWTDAEGNLWLWGGFGTDAVGNWTYLNDLWKFSPSVGEWTWMGGSSTAPTAPKGVYGAMGAAATTNMPGPRGSSATWTDGQGNLWLYGGFGYDLDGTNGYLGDLWRYSPTGGEWTWMGGSQTANNIAVYGQRGAASASETPGARDAMLFWQDGKGDLWLYGGFSYANSAETQFNQWADLWMFSTASGQWTWESGSSQPNQAANFGQMGVAATNNSPGSRQSAATWIDASGNLWLYGGIVNGSSADILTMYPDLWKYSGGQWTWMGGGASLNLVEYGMLGVAAATNLPPIRSLAAAWTDGSGHFLLFGGDVPGASAGPDLLPLPNTALNDLWEYTP